MPGLHAGPSRRASMDLPAGPRRTYRSGPRHTLGPYLDGPTRPTSTYLPARPRRADSTEGDDLMRERLNEIRQHLEGPTTSPLFLLDACRWLVDEVEENFDDESAMTDLEAD